MLYVYMPLVLPQLFNTAVTRASQGVADSGGGAHHSVYRGLQPTLLVGVHPEVPQAQHV